MRTTLCRCFSMARSQLASPSAISFEAATTPAASGSTPRNSGAIAQSIMDRKSFVPDMKNVQNDEIRGHFRKMLGVSALAAGAPPEQVQRDYEAGTSQSPSPDSLANQSVVYEIPPMEDPLLQFLTNLMMTSGKKATARNHVSTVLSTIRLRSSSDPLPILRQAIRLAAPMIRLTQQKRGGKSESVPIALGERQSVRLGIQAILKASDKRSNPTAGGSKVFGERVAYEIEAVINGTSDVLKRKDQLHSAATVARSKVVQSRAR